MKSAARVKQFRSDGCNSYILADLTTQKAAIIDPNLSLMEDYRAYFAQHGLKPVIALDTHTHADHYSATHLFHSEYGAEIGMSHKTESQRPTRKLKSGEAIEIGGLKLEMLETPGHTRDAACFFGEGMVFTGDTLFISSSGRTDFDGSSAADQWTSIHKVLARLPGKTIVYPGHEYNDILFSTIDTEKSKNPHWLIPSQQEFIQFKNSERIENPDDETRARLEYNREPGPEHDVQHALGSVTACGVPSKEQVRFASISVEKYKQKLDTSSDDVGYLDVREEDEYREAHIPGTLNIPLSEVGLHLDEISRMSRVYVSCLAGSRSSAVVKTLTYLGIPDAVNVTGGFRAWKNAGLPVE